MAFDVIAWEICIKILKETVVFIISYLHTNIYQKAVEVLDELPEENKKTWTFPSLSSSGSSTLLPALLLIISKLRRACARNFYVFLFFMYSHQNLNNVLKKITFTGGPLKLSYEILFAVCCNYLKYRLCKKVDNCKMTTTLEMLKDMGNLFVKTGSSDFFSTNTNLKLDVDMRRRI